MKRKTNYLPPRTEIIAAQSEGIMAASLGDYTGGNPAFPSTSTGTSPRTRNSVGSGTQEFEDMINDLFTVIK